MELMLFNIQKFSLHDGPGIRTVVFLKGCPLRCGWCSNPESQRMEIQTLIDGDKRTQSGEHKNIEDVLAVCLQDWPFYEESGGGVTLSGGEPLMQPDAALALLRALRERGIHTAMETTGFASVKVFDRVSAAADLLLFDVKHWDEQRHIEGTGVSNRPILDNMCHAIASGIELLPRIPVIRGYNDALSDAQAFAKLLSCMGARRAQLLPFHQFGEKKHEMLGMRYAFAAAAPLHPENLTDYQAAFESQGVDAFF